MGDQLRGTGGIWNDPIQNPPGTEDASYSTGTGSITITTGGSDETFDWNSTNGCYYNQGASSSNATTKIEYTCVVSDADGCIRWLWEKFTRTIPGSWTKVSGGFALKNS